MYFTATPIDLAFAPQVRNSYLLNNFKPIEDNSGRFSIKPENSVFYYLFR